MLALSLFANNQLTCEFDQHVVGLFCQQATVDWSMFLGAGPLYLVETNVCLGFFLLTDANLLACAQLILTVALIKAPAAH